MMRKQKRSASPIILYMVMNHYPGIGYAYYRKDLKKIESPKILDALKESAKDVDICAPFYQVLSEVIPNLNCTDYHIRPPKKSDKGKNDSQISNFDAEEDALF